MALRRLAPRFIDWRLSRIDEETTDRASCSSGGSTPPSPPLPPPPPLLLQDEDPAAAEEASPPPSPAASPPSSAVIYSNADEWRKQQLERSAADDERDALRFIKEKYDSLGKINVEKPSPANSETPFVASETAPTSNQPEALAVYQNVGRDSSGHQTEVDSASSVPGSGGTPPQGTSAKSPQRVSCGCSRHNEVAGQIREMVQRRAQNPPCQCHHHHHHQQQQQVEVRRERLQLADCIPRSPLSDAELIQVDLFYRSYRSSVHVCTCMATLSFSRPVHAPPAAKSRPVPASSEDHDDGVWACVRTGIPVIVKDSAGGRRRRRVYVLLVERGTGFELWRAPLDRLADYTVTSAVIPLVAGSGGPGSAAAAAPATVTCSQHTMRLSVDETVSVTARLAFDDQTGADEFHRQLVGLSATADVVAPAPAPGGFPQAVTAATGCGRKKQRRRKGALSISKADISQPCCFSHVTRLERGVPCRGRPGLHIVVASGRQIQASGGGEPSPSNPPGTSCCAAAASRTAGTCSHSSFKSSHSHI